MFTFGCVSNLNKDLMDVFKETPSVNPPILMQVLLKCDLRPGGLESRMFCGFRSLWMIPLACRTLMAPAICCRKTLMVSSLSVPLAADKRAVTICHGGHVFV